MIRASIWHAASGAVLLLLLGGRWTARADEPDRSAWLLGRSYERIEGLASGGAEIEAYVAQQESGPIDTVEPAWFRFLVVRSGEVVEAYHADLLRPEDGPAHLDLRSEDEGAESAGVRVVVEPLGSDGSWIRAAWSALAVAGSASAPWKDAAERLSRAAAEVEPHGRRPLVLDAYRALERAHREHPRHVGILRDLLVADQLLVPLEVGTDRGANLAFLWRRHAADLSAHADEDERRWIDRVIVTCAIAEGCYAQAAVLIPEAFLLEDPHDAAVRDALAGQDAQEPVSTQEVAGRAGTLLVETYRCAAELPGEGIPFHRLTFLTSTPDDPARLKPVWYSLTAQTSGERTRWALYGWVGGSRRLLRLYGPTEPDEQAAIEAVLAHVRTAVRAEDGK